MHRIFVGLTILLVFSLQGSAQTAREVLDKFIVSSGGRERISQITNTRFAFSGVLKGDSLRVTIIKERPNRLALITDFQQNHSGVFFNNGKCVRVIGNEKENITDTTTLEEIWIQSHILPEMSYDLKKQRIEFARDTVNQVAYNKLTVYSSTAHILFVNYYHPETGLLDILVDRYGTTTYYQDYQMYKGFNLPHTATIIRDETQFEIHLTAVGIDEPPQKELFN